MSFGLAYDVSLCHSDVMDMTAYVEMLEERLAAAAAVGDESTRRVASLLGDALDAGTRLAIMAALSEFATEVSAVLTDRIVETRLDGAEISAAVSAAPVAEPREDEESGAPESGDTSRVTLRLPDELKVRAGEAAAREGLSLNAWLARAVQDALRTTGARPTRGTRLRGWVEA